MRFALEVAAFLLLIPLNAEPVASTSSAYDYPKQVAIAAGKSAVDMDFLKLREKDLHSAERAARSLPVSKREAAVVQALQLQNQKVLVFLDSYALSAEDLAPAEPQLAAIDAKQAQILHDAILAHPIVSVEGSAKYDGPRRRIGYCFGRAAFVHWELLRRGVDPRAIAKLFAVGGLHYDGSPWEYHVSTIVRATDGGWWAIDGYDDKPLKIKPWMERVQGWTRGGTVSAKTRFYFTDAVKFRTLPGGYNDKSLNPPYYKGFFTDLLKWFSDHPARHQEIFTLAK